MDTDLRKQSGSESRRLWVGTDSQVEKSPSWVSPGRQQHSQLVMWDANNRMIVRRASGRLTKTEILQSPIRCLHPKGPRSKRIPFGTRVAFRSLCHAGRMQACFPQSLILCCGHPRLSQHFPPSYNEAKNGSSTKD